MDSRRLKSHNEASARKGVLTQEAVLRVKAQLGRKEHPLDIANREGVSYQTITRIRDGKTWGWLRCAGDLIEAERPELSEGDREAAGASLGRLMEELRGEGKAAETASAPSAVMEKAAKFFDATE